MKLNELSPQQLAQLYRQELTSAFPPEELKPLRSMLSLMEQGRYQALGLYDGEDLVAYALIWLEPGCPFALLDYLGTMAGLRDRGLGSRMLTEFPQPVNVLEQAQTADEKSDGSLLPKEEAASLALERKRNALQAQLHNAVEEERYEDAARLRDELRSLPQE